MHTLVSRWCYCTSGQAATLVGPLYAFEIARVFVPQDSFVDNLLFPDLRYTTRNRAGPELSEPNSSYSNESE